MTSLNLPCAGGREDFGTLPAVFKAISTHLRIKGEAENTQAWVSVFCVLPLAQGVPVRWDQWGWPRDNPEEVNGVWLPWVTQLCQYHTAPWLHETGGHKDIKRIGPGSIYL